MSQVEKLEKVLKVSGNMKEATDTVAKMKEAEPVKNIYWSTGETKAEYIKGIKDAEMEKEKKEAKMLAKKLAATVAKEKSVKNLDLANGKSRAEYLDDLKKAEGDKAKKLEKAVKATKAKAKKNLSEEKNLFFGESPIFASKEEIKKFGHKEAKPTATKTVAQPKNDAAQPTNTATQPEGPSVSL